MVVMKRDRRLDQEDTKDILQMTGGQMEDQRLVFIILSEPNPTWPIYILKPETNGVKQHVVMHFSFFPSEPLLFLAQI